MAEGMNDLLNMFVLASGILDVSLAEGSEKRYSEDGWDRTIFVRPSFSVQHCVYWALPI